MTIQYKLINHDPYAIFKIDGNSVVSVYKNEANPMYQEYLAWLAEGNEPLPADDLE